MLVLIAIVKMLPISIATLLLLTCSIGILKTKNPLQMLHFVTIIEVVCIPLALLSLILHEGLAELKMIFCIFFVILLSPITSYFLAKAHMKYAQNISNETHSENTQKPIL